MYHLGLAILTRAPRPSASSSENALVWTAIICLISCRGGQYRALKNVTMSYVISLDNHSVLATSDCLPRKVALSWLETRVLLLLCIG